MVISKGLIKCFTGKIHKYLVCFPECAHKFWFCLFLSLTATDIAKVQDWLVVISQFYCIFFISWNAFIEGYFFSYISYTKA